MSETATKIFKYRSYTPIPFLILMLLYENANIWSLIIGFIIAVFGEMVRLWGVSWAGSETRTTGRVGGSFLVIRGPFAHLRNPLYFGNIFIYLGLGIMSFALFPYLQIVALVFFAFQYYYIIIEEEKYLAETFGGQYKKYVENVPRFIPRLIPYKDKTVEQPAFRFNAGLRSEKRTLQALSFIVITIVLLWYIGRL